VAKKKKEKKLWEKYPLQVGLSYLGTRWEGILLLWVLSACCDCLEHVAHHLRRFLAVFGLFGCLLFGFSSF
jgi:hypothetical protein